MKGITSKFLEILAHKIRGDLGVVSNELYALKGEVDNLALDKSSIDKSIERCQRISSLFKSLSYITNITNESIAFTSTEALVNYFFPNVEVLSSREIRPDEDVNFYFRILNLFKTALIEIDAYSSAEYCLSDSDLEITFPNPDNDKPEKKALKSLSAVFEQFSSETILYPCLLELLLLESKIDYAIYNVEKVAVEISIF